MFIFLSSSFDFRRVRDQIVADGFDTPLDWQKSGKCSGITDEMFIFIETKIWRLEYISN